MTEGQGDISGEAFSRNNDPKLSKMRVFGGIITDVTPSLNAFRVEIPNDVTRICTTLSITGGSVVTNSGFEVGDQVLIAGGIGDTFGVILGKITETSVYGTADPRSFVTLSESFKQGPFQKGLFETLGGKPNEYVPAWTLNQPLLKTNTGELFIGAPVGPKFFIDPFMSCMAVNDATGVWAFRDDSMLRIAGINFQKVTAGSYEEELNDNGECTYYRGQCLNSWEQLGYYKKPSSDIITQNEKWYKKEEPTAPRELTDKEAKPFHRVIELGGYLGKGKQSMVLAPPESGEYGKYGKKEEKQLGLSRIVQNTDGFIGIESAQGISIVKSSAIPAIQRIYMPENDADGDNKDNYKFDHVNYEPLSVPKLTASKTNKILQSVMAVEDYYIYTMQFKSVSALLRHAKDWFIPETRAVQKGSFRLKNEINKLRQKYVLDLPTSYKLKIDDKEQEYYPVEAGIHLLPEGGVVIYDGYGGEIRMAGGHVTISAPGGVNLRSGRDAQIWAGRNLSVRAQEGIDQSATKGSVHIKAEKNLELLGGNSGHNSGVIIESKGQGDMDFSSAGDKKKVGGIVLKTEKGTISALGSTLYVGTDKNGSGIMVDSGKGRTGLYTASRIKQDYVREKHSLNFGTFGSGYIDKVYESTKDQYTVPCRMYVGGMVVVVGHAFVDGVIECDKHIITKQAENTPMVAPLTGKAARAFDNVIRSADAYITHQVIANSQGVYDNMVKRPFYQSKKPGNPTVVRQAGFSYRTDNELNLTEFYVYADRWQTICDTATPWKEKKVSTEAGDGEYPYPGKKYFTQQPCFVTQELVFCNDSGVLQHKSGDQIDDKYQNPEYNKPTLKSLKDYPAMG